MGWGGQAPPARASCKRTGPQQAYSSSFRLSVSKHHQKLRLWVIQDYSAPPALFGRTRRSQEGLWWWMQNEVWESVGDGPVTCNELGGGVVGTRLRGLHHGEMFHAHATSPFLRHAPFWNTSPEPISDGLSLSITMKYRVDKLWGAAVD